MRKLLTAGIFGTILSLTGANYADASIISRGFFDEAMENYATNTALDLKANQTDLTALSNKIGDAWPYSSDISGGLYNLSWQLYPQEITLENASDLVRFLFGGKIESGINQGGVLSILGQSVVDIGAYDVNTGQIDEGFRSLTQLTNGWTSTDGTTYLGVKDLNTKTGSYYWGPENEEYKYSNIPYLEELFPDLSPDKNLAISNMANNILVNYTQPDFPGLAGVTDKLLNGWTDAKGGTIINPGLKGMYGGWTYDNGGLANPGLNGIYAGWTEAGYNFPGFGFISLGERNVIDSYDGHGTARLLINGAKATTIDGVDYTGPVYPLWKLSEGVDKIGSIETKIGDLPTEIPNMVSTWTKYGFVENPGTPIDLPDTIGGMFAMLFNEDTSYNGLSLGNIMGKILMGFDAIGSRIEGLANLTSVYNLRGDSPIVTAVNANTAKIGTVPDGYDNVGAALTAMKSDIDAKNLPSTSDDGQYVLTAKKVGDTITYTWVKMDLTNEEQAQ